MQAYFAWHAKEHRNFPALEVDCTASAIDFGSSALKVGGQDPLYAHMTANRHKRDLRL
jgi:hypothetical protein